MADHHDAERPEIISHNARWGLILFVVYLAFYAVFVLLSAFAPQVMAREFYAGVNLAICYGLALIVAALLLAAIYMIVTRAEARR
jgi:uncharacterized membrane protein (DUF485 family)